MTEGLYKGDCLDMMRAMEPESVDAIVTDPPYGLAFMGKDWDDYGRQTEKTERGGYNNKGILPGYGRGGKSADRERFRRKSNTAYEDAMYKVFAEAIRVAKPGAHLLAFGGTRTYHRLACAIEDAGWEVRDCLAWVYATGFPKSLDVSKALDKEAGAEREVLYEGKPVKRMIPGADQDKTGSWIKDSGREFVPTETAPATDLAREWAGWGTALKPSYEPIIVARKPLCGTVAQNVREHGTGALNIDACRVAHTYGKFFGQGGRHGETLELKPSGRWPANLLLSHAPCCGEVCVEGCPIRAIDEQSGVSKSTIGNPRSSSAPGNGYGMTHTGSEYSDAGGASRFFTCFEPEVPFLYCPKASRAERNAGLDGMREISAGERAGGRKEGSAGLVMAGGKANPYAGTSTPAQNPHPTVKPLAVIEWLLKLATREGALVLDPFLGSGTTAVACIRLGRRWAGAEITAEYWPIIEARVAHAERERAGKQPELRLEGAAS